MGNQEEDDDDLWWWSQVQGLHRLRHADHEERGLHEHDEGCWCQHPPWCCWCWCPVITIKKRTRQPPVNERDAHVYGDHHYGLLCRNYVEPPANQWTFK